MSADCIVRVLNATFLGRKLHDSKLFIFCRRISGALGAFINVTAISASFALLPVITPMEPLLLRLGPDRPVAFHIVELRHRFR